MLTRLASILAFALLFALVWNTALALNLTSGAGDPSSAPDGTDRAIGDPFTIRMYLDYLHSIIAKRW